MGVIDSGVEINAAAAAAAVAAALAGVVNERPSDDVSSSPDSRDVDVAIRLATH